MRGVVLTYHSNNVLGNEYANNDHLALAEDLALMNALGVPVVTLGDLVDGALGDCPVSDRPPAVALSFDDGSWFDWFDLPHPTLGPQRSFRSILAAAPMPVHASAFVIASPAARTELDRTCLIGEGWWGEEWWAEASRGELISVENHSWDHNHDSLDQTLVSAPGGGSFHSITSRELADAEILGAKRYIDERCAPRVSRLFAYPYGDCPAYLRDEYFPRFGADMGMTAAFGTEPNPVTADSNRWQLGRYVCGQHWGSTDDLRRLLVDAGISRQ